MRTAQTSANGHGIANDVAHTLDQVQGQAVAFSHSAAGNSHGIAYVVEGTPPIRGGGAGNSMPAVAYTKSKRAQSKTDNETWVDGEVTPTINVFDTGDTRATTVVAVRPQSSMQVRRLTPLECEFLQGFPPQHTNVTFRKKPAADGPRYRALGNSMAVPCMWWLGNRIRLSTGQDL